MVGLLLAALVTQQQTPPAKSPLYDGAKDFADAIERAAKADPAFLVKVEPFATGYWYKRAVELSEYSGNYVLQELIICGNMIRHWNPKIGNELREFALRALIEFPNRDVPELLKSDLRLEYVALLGEHVRMKDDGTVLFDAGSRLGMMSTQLMFAEFVTLEELKANSALPLKQIAQFPLDRPTAADSLKRRFETIGVLSKSEKFTVDTMRQIGFTVAEALTTQVPLNFKWKVPPDPPVVGFICVSPGLDRYFTRS